MKIQFEVVGMILPFNSDRSGFKVFKDKCITFEQIFSQWNDVRVSQYRFGDTIKKSVFANGEVFLRYNTYHVVKILAIL